MKLSNGCRMVCLLAFSYFASAAWGVSPAELKARSFEEWKAARGDVVGPKTPSYVDCWTDRVVIYPDKIAVSVEQLQQPGNAFEQFLNKVQENTANEYIIVMVRPGSVKTYRMVRNAIGRRPIDVGYDAVEADFKVNWDEAIQALNVESATVVQNSESLVAELTAKRAQVRDFEAKMLESSPLGELSCTVSYRADGNLIRVERPADALRGSTYYDGETWWEQRGSAFMKMAGVRSPYSSWVPELNSLVATNAGVTVAVKATDRWVIIERQWKPGGTEAVKKMLQDPAFLKRAAEIEAAMAELRRKRGLPPLQTQDIQEQIERLDVVKESQGTQTERYWFSRNDGLCHRRESFDESGKLRSGWKFATVRTNIGLQPEVFRPHLEGKRVFDPSRDSPAKMPEAMMEQAMKSVPELRIKPRAFPTTKAPAFFECRNNEVFFVDKDELDKQVAGVLAGLSPGTRGGDLSVFLRAIQEREIGNAYYTVDPKSLLAGRMGLQPRAGVRGEPLGDLQRRDGKFQQWLAQLDQQGRYISFLLRDDSFAVFRQAREIAERAGFDTVWELLGPDEPIKFGEAGLAPAR